MFPVQHSSYEYLTDQNIFYRIDVQFLNACSHFKTMKKQALFHEANSVSINNKTNQTKSHDSIF